MHQNDSIASKCLVHIFTYVKTQNRHLRHISKVHRFYSLELILVILSFMTLKTCDTGIYVTVFVVRGHINDTTQSSMHGTDNSDDFWEDVYQWLTFSANTNNGH